jgi:hypothetical protein
MSLAPVRRLTFPDQQQDSETADTSLASEYEGDVKETLVSKRSDFAGLLSSRGTLLARCFPSTDHELISLTA